MSNSNYVNKNFKDAILKAVASSNMVNWVQENNYYNEMFFKTEVINGGYCSVKFKYDSKSKVIYWELNEFREESEAIFFISEDKFSSLDIESFNYYCNKVDKLAKIALS